MRSRNDAIRKHIADMLAVESHILEAVQRQLEETETMGKHAAAAALLRRIADTLTRHRETLERTADAYGDSLQHTLKQKITEVIGAAAGVYDKLREHTLSRMLRDDYTALSLAAMSYTMMHAFGLSIKEPQVAALSLQHLEDLTPLLMELSEVLPRVVVLEVQEENDFPVDDAVARKAVEGTQQAWSPRPTGATL